MTASLKNGLGTRAESKESNMGHIEITNLINQVAEHLDGGQPEAAAALFDCAQVQLQQDGERLNSEQLLQVWKQAFVANKTVITRHLISNPIIEIDRERGVAHCRSTYLVMKSQDGEPLQPIEAGRYQDEFLLEGEAWRFASRLCLVDRGADQKPSTIKSSQVESNDQSAFTPQSHSGSTRDKILSAAQQVFSSVGYSEAGIRRIADAVGLSSTILFRHFGTKAGLFEAALVAAIGEPRQPVAREQFGRHVADMLADPTQINCPHAMSLLATGNEEAREITIRVLKQYTILPMMEWLGEPHRESRAKQIMALCAGFALYNTQLNISESKKIDSHMVDWLANSIQAIVDEGT